MNEAQKQLLLQRIDEVLFYVWDPIGANELAPEARDEYHSYADHVWHMVLAGKSKSEISEYLAEARTERMECDPLKPADNAAAELILDWKDYLEDPERLGS